MKQRRSNGRRSQESAPADLRCLSCRCRQDASQLAGMCALSYRDIDPNRVEDCELLARWYNDPSLKHLYSLFPDAQSLSETSRLSTLRGAYSIHRTQDPIET